MATGMITLPDGRKAKVTVGDHIPEEEREAFIRQNLESRGLLTTQAPSLSPGPKVPTGRSSAAVNSIFPGLPPSPDTTQTGNTVLPKSSLLQSALSPESSQMVGGLGGAALGTAFAGFPIGTIGGGLLGTLAGDQANLFARNIVDPETVPQEAQTFKGNAERVGRLALEDLAFSAGGELAGQAFKSAGKPLLGKLFGVRNRQARNVTNLAQSQGVDLGPINVSPRKAVRSAAKVLGVFPFVGTPLRKAQQRQLGQIDDTAADILNTLAPTATLAETSEVLTKAAQRRFTKFRTVASTLYKRFNDLADTLPPQLGRIIPTQPMNQSVTALADDALKGRVFLREPGLPLDATQQAARGKILLKDFFGRKQGRPFKDISSDPLVEFIEQFSQLDERITVRQARELERSLSKAFSFAKTQGFDLSRLTEVKKALEASKNALDVSLLKPEQGAAILTAWQRANDFFREASKPFETVTGKQFGKVDRSVFKLGKLVPGSKNSDEIFDSVFNAKSAEGLRDLRSIVGPREFNRATRKHIERAYQASIRPAKEGAGIGEIFSAADFERRLGLGTADGDAILKEALGGTKVSVQEVKNFLKVAKRATDVAISDPSTFLARRIVLSGGRGLLGGLALGAGSTAAGGPGITTAAVLTFAARKGARFLTNPEQLRLMTTVIKDGPAEHIKRNALARLIRLMDRDAQQESGLAQEPQSQVTQAQ